MNKSLLKRRIPTVSSAICSQQFQQATLEKVDALQRHILQTSEQTTTPLEALRKAYGQLNELQKIAFILAGGAAQILRNQQRARGLAQKKREAFRDPDTGKLPVLC